MPELDPRWASAVLAALAVWLLLGQVVESRRLRAVGDRWRRRARLRGLDWSARPVAGLALVGAALAGLVAGMAVGGRVGLGVGPGVGLVLLGVGPAVAERLWRRQHEHRLARGVPGVLRQWAVALDGGLAQEEALERVAQRVSGVMGLELRRVLLARALRCGHLADCWGLRAQAVGSPALAEVAGTVGAVAQTGAPLGHLLRTLAADLDARHVHRDELQAAARGPLWQLGICYLLLLGLALSLQGLPALMGDAIPNAPGLSMGHWLTLAGAGAMSLCIVGLALRANAALE